MKYFKRIAFGALIGALLIGFIYVVISTFQPNLLAAFKAAPPMVKSGIGLFAVLLAVILVRDKIE